LKYQLKVNKCFTESDTTGAVTTVSI